MEKFEFDLPAAGKILWADRRRIALHSLAGAVLGVAISFLVPRVYQSQALLLPVAGADQDKLTALAGQLGGLASLTGFSLGNVSKVDKTQVALETLKSRDFLAKYAQTRGLDVALFAGKSWDAKNHRWNLDRSIYDENAKKWTRKGPVGPEPSSSEIQERLLREHIDVLENKKTGLIQISMNAPAPELAKAWLEQLIEEINSYGRNREITEKEQNIGYLMEQIQKTDVAELRQVFFNLIQRQQSDLMIARTQREFVFKTVDPPAMPIRKVSPRRSQFLLFGFFLALLATLITRLAPREKRSLWLKATN